MGKPWREAQAAEGGMVAEESEELDCAGSSSSFDSWSLSTLRLPKRQGRPDALGGYLLLIKFLHEIFATSMGVMTQSLNFTLLNLSVGYKQ